MGDSPQFASTVPGRKSGTNKKSLKSKRLAPLEGALQLRSPNINILMGICLVILRFFRCSCTTHYWKHDDV